jgi:hypothetical protein
MLMIPFIHQEQLPHCRIANMLTDYKKWSSKSLIYLLFLVVSNYWLNFYRTCIECVGSQNLKTYCNKQKMKRVHPITQHIIRYPITQHIIRYSNIASIAFPFPSIIFPCKIWCQAHGMTVGPKQSAFPYHKLFCSYLKVL